MPFLSALLKKLISNKTIPSVWYFSLLMVIIPTQDIIFHPFEAKEFILAIIRSILGQRRRFVTSDVIGVLGCLICRSFSGFGTFFFDVYDVIVPGPRVLKLEPKKAFMGIYYMFMFRHDYTRQCNVTCSSFQSPYTD